MSPQLCPVSLRFHEKAARYIESISAGVRHHGTSEPQVYRTVQYGNPAGQNWPVWNPWHWCGVGHHDRRHRPFHWIDCWAHRNPSDFSPAGKRFFTRVGDSTGNRPVFVSRARSRASDHQAQTSTVRGHALWPFNLPWSRTLDCGNKILGVW